MANKRFGLGMLVLVLVFGVFLTGCGGAEDDKDDDSEGYTFEFRVKHTNSWDDRAITKIEFINGPNTSSPVLQTQTVSLSYNEMSSTYTVSGFTEKAGDGKRIFGVRVTFDDGGTDFYYSSATNKAKTEVRYGYNGIYGSGGNGEW